MVQLSGWLIGPPIAGLFLGKWLDERYQTAPWLFLATMLVAFGLSTFGIFKEAVALTRQFDTTPPKPPTPTDDASN